jgi:hypothetical protein
VFEFLNLALDLVPVLGQFNVAVSGLPFGECLKDCGVVDELGAESDDERVRDEARESRTLGSFTFVDRAIQSTICPLPRRTGAALWP